MAGRALSRAGDPGEEELEKTGMAGYGVRQPDEILVTEGTSLNLFKLATAALRARDFEIYVF